MQVTRSSRYNEKRQLIFEQDTGEKREVHLRRVWGGMAFHGVPHALVVVGEEQFFRDTHYFILCEAATDYTETLHDLFDIARRIQVEYKITRWLGRLDVNVKEILSKNNKQVYNTGVGNISVLDVPRIGEEINHALSNVHMLTRSHDKRLHFFNESTSVAALKSLAKSSKIKAEDNPRATALANVIGGFLEYRADVVDQSMLIPEPDGLF
jgi:hypothetical protein